MNKINMRTPLLSLAVHLPAILEQKTYMEDLWQEIHNLDVRMGKLYYSRNKGKGVDTEWNPSKKPASEWTEEDANFVITEDRINMLRELEDCLKKETKLIRGFSRSKNFQTPRLLHEIILESLDLPVGDLPCPFEAKNFDRERDARPGSLGPTKLPTWIQALCLHELQAQSDMEDGDRSMRLKMIARLQYELISRLRRYLISELFPVEEQVDQSRMLMINCEWRLWVIR